MKTLPQNLSLSAKNRALDIVVLSQNAGDAPSEIETTAIMAADKALALSQHTKQAAQNDAVMACGNRLMNRNQSQFEHIQPEKGGRSLQSAHRRPAQWWWREGKTYYLSIQSYRLLTELSKGNYSIKCADLDAVAHALSAMDQAIAAGGE